MNSLTGRGPGARSPWPRPTLVASVMAVMTAAVLLAAACGNSPSSAGSGGSPNGGGSAIAASAVRYTSCMRSHGVPAYPDPNSSGQFDKSAIARAASSDPRFSSANQGCQHLLPAGITGEHADVAQALAFSRCMRSHGVTNFPDPASDGRIPDPASLGIDQGSPRFEAANQACGRYRPPYMPSNAQYNAYARTHGSS
jgi:hypothetical protein